MLNSDYRDMLSLLVKHDVEFMLIGAYALAVHGVPRSTGEIDFFVECSVANARKIHAALVEFGAPISSSDAEYLSRYGNMYQVGVAPCRIDVITQIDGVTYEEVRTQLVTVDGIEMKVISKEDFIKYKRAAGRMKDLADIEALESGA